MTQNKIEMKAEIEKILEDFAFAEKHSISDRAIYNATSSITSLIIKWLEEKEIELSKAQSAYFASVGRMSNEYDKYNQGKGRNHLITELVEELK